MRHTIGTAAVLFSAFSPLALAVSDPVIVLKQKLTSAQVQPIDGESNKVSIDFPESTDIRDIAHAVALWTGKPMIVDRNVHGKVQIVAPERLPLEEANQRFLAALEQLGLAADVHHGVTQILPARIVTPESSAEREALTAPAFGVAETLVAVDYPEPTEIKNVIQAVAAWSGRRVIMDRNVNGKIQIFAAKPVEKAKAYQIYLAALDQLGLAELDRGGVVQILPKRMAANRRDLRMPAPPADSAGQASIDFPTVSEIRDVLAKSRPWYGRDLVMDRNVNGKVQILAPGRLTKDEAYKILVAALDTLGLTTEPQGTAVKILPYREFDAGQH